MEYKTFTIRERDVLLGDISTEEYTVTGDVIAYEVIHPLSGYILGVYKSTDRARDVIDLYGCRWLLN